MGGLTLLNNTDSLKQFPLDKLENMLKGIQNSRQIAEERIAFLNKSELKLMKLIEEKRKGI